MNKFLYKIFKWNKEELLMNTIGVILFAFSINFFIEPADLYAGGVLGLAQLVNKLFNYLFNLSLNGTSIIYLIINVPLFILAFFKISKSFCTRTIYTIGVQTVALLLIPIPDKIIVEEIITNVIIGGAIAGVGCALILSATGSTGGTDIIGIVLSSRNTKFSVGKFALIFNLVIFGISGILYGVSTMVYSIILSVV